MSRLVFSVNPLVAFGIVILLCHGMMWALAFVVEHRVLLWRKQYLGFVYGDILLAAAVAFATYVNQVIGPDQNHWSSNGYVKLVGLIAAIALAVWRWAFNDYRAYSVGQSASPTKLYHDTLFITLGFWLFLVVTPLIDHTWWVLVPIFLVAGWRYLGLLDDQAPWKARYAHVDFQWPVKTWVKVYLDPYLK